LSMMNARQDVKSSVELSNTLFNQVSAQMTGVIDKSIKEIVK
jgi:hypothetical protein